MQSILRDLLIGIMGSVVGALIVLLSTSGLRLTKEASKRVAARRNAEREQWQKGTAIERQDITNRYLFGILKYMLLGNLMWALPAVAMPIANAASIDVYQGNLLIYAVGSAIGVIFFFRGIGLIIRYTSLCRSE